MSRIAQARALLAQHRILDEPRLLAQSAKQLIRHLDEIGYTDDAAIPDELRKTVDDMRAVIAHHEQSPVEFSRDHDFIICSNDYDIRKLTATDIQNYINAVEQLHCLLAR